MEAFLLDDQSDLKRQSVHVPKQMYEETTELGWPMLSLDGGIRLIHMAEDINTKTINIY